VNEQRGSTFEVDQQRHGVRQAVARPEV